jgi:Rod binding domain-containing protein
VQHTDSSLQQLEAALLAQGGLGEAGMPHHQLSAAAAAAAAASADAEAEAKLEKMRDMLRAALGELSATRARAHAAGAMREPSSRQRCCLSFRLHVSWHCMS